MFDVYEIKINELKIFESFYDFKARTDESYSRTCATCSKL